MWIYTNTYRGMSFIIFKPTLSAWRSVNKISLQVILVPWEGSSLRRKLILMPPTVNGIFPFLAFFFILFWIFSSFLCSTGKAYLEAPTFLPQLPNNLSNSGIPMILCGLQALVQVPQYALHRRIYCRPQKVPHVKGPQIQDLVLSQKSRPKQKPGSPNPLWGCLPTPKMELPMTPQGDLSIFPSMLSVPYHCSWWILSFRGG